MLERVIAAPDDDELRVVYGDYLMERGDPRGELIHLQCEERKRELRPEETARIEELIAKHHREWLGEIWEAVSPGEWTWDRGFMTECRLQGTQLAIELAARDPAWRFIHTLDLSLLPTNADAAFAALAESSPTLKTVKGIHPGALYRLLQAPYPRGIESLTASIMGWSGDDQFVSAFTAEIAAQSLPALKHFAIADILVFGTVTPELINSPLGKRLESFAPGDTLHRLEKWLAALRSPKRVASDVNLRELILREADGSETAIVRGVDGQFSGLEFRRVDSTFRQRAIRLVQEIANDLPSKTLTRMIFRGVNLHKDQETKIREAVKKQVRLSDLQFVR